MQDSVVFEASRSVRWGDRAMAIIVGGLIVVLGAPLVGLGAAALLLQGLPDWLQIVLGILMSVAVGWGVIWLILERLRFRVELTPQHVIVGRGWRRKVIPYEAITKVVQSPYSSRKSTTPWVRVHTRRRSVRVVLGEDAEEFGRAIVKVAPWAVFIDDHGIEHLPDSPTDLARVLGTLADHQGKRMRSYRLGAVAAAIALAVFVPLLASGALAGPVGVGWISPGLIHVLIFTAGGGVTCLVQCRNYARRLRETRAKLAQLQGQDESAVGSLQRR